MSANLMSSKLMPAIWIPTKSIRTLLIVALTGTSLSGCALIDKTADGVWSGTKSVARFVSTPVRYLLRDAPQDDTQFAENSVPVTPLADVETLENETVEIVVFEPALATPKAVQMTETIIEVDDAKVLGTTVAAMPLTTIPAGTKSVTETRTSRSIEIVETVNLSPSTSVDVLTVGDISYIREEGQGSLQDWRSCDVEAGGFWEFGVADNTGHMNPVFERCMRDKAYTLETEVHSTQILPASAPITTTTTVSPLP